MKSAPHGQSTWVAEVTNVSARVFWILLAEEKRFVPFADFPWFQEAPIRTLTHLEWPSPNHLEWPDQEVDLAVESIRHPALFPLASRTDA
jgi:hypothetical protein